MWYMEREFTAGDLAAAVMFLGPIAGEYNGNGDAPAGELGYQMMARQEHEREAIIRRASVERLAALDSLTAATVEWEVQVYSPTRGWEGSSSLLLAPGDAPEWGHVDDAFMPPRSGMRVRTRGGAWMQIHPPAQAVE